MTGHTLDRLVEFDERSRAFPIRAVVPAKPRSYTWACAPVLDQGSEGACVGFAWTHELAARPVVVAEASDDLARSVYREAQKVDQWPGEGYEGTSVIAGAKVLGGRGWLSEYRWAFGIDDLILAVGLKGPAVLGINWYSGMFGLDADGYVRPTGRVAGGHAILCRGVSLPMERFLVHNSWGPGWGRSGLAWLAFNDAERLLGEDGEACIPVRRTRPAA